MLRYDTFDTFYSQPLKFPIKLEQFKVWASTQLLYAHTRRLLRLAQGPGERRKLNSLLINLI
jgi:hypothetical protein